MEKFPAVVLGALNLRLAEDKTVVSTPEDGFDVLGFFLKKTVDGVTVKPSAKSVAKLKMRLAELAMQIPPVGDARNNQSKMTAVEDGWDVYFDL